MTPELPGVPLPPRVSVIIVSRNRKELLHQSLTELTPAHQVIVVDNASTDGAASLAFEFPSARFIPLPKNFGLTKALNLGFRGAEGEFLVFLHDDVNITAEAVTKLADTLESNADLGAVCPLFPGTRQACDLPTPAHPYPDWHTVSESTDSDVECASGSAIMVRHQFIRAMRQLDERYGNYGSDLDLSAQIVLRASKKIRIVCNVKALHRVLGEKTSLTEADRIIGTSVFLSKYYGSAPGLKFRISATLKSVFGFRLVMAKHLLSNQKLDGTQS